MPRKSSSRKKDVIDPNSASMKEIADAIDAVAQEYKTTDEVPAGSFAIYLFPAVLVVALPVYLYISPMFGLNLKNDAIVFGAATFLSSILLALSYSKTTSRHLTSLLKKRSAPKASSENERAEGEKIFLKDCKTEAMAYSLFNNNLAFTLLFLTLSFWFFPSLPLDIPKDFLYGLSVVLPAVVIYLNTHGIINIV